MMGYETVKWCRGRGIELLASQGRGCALEPLGSNNLRHGETSVSPTLFLLKSLPLFLIILIINGAEEGI